MDPITAAILGALGWLGESVIMDAYKALKAAIAKKCGLNSDLVEAMNKLENKPDSSRRREMLKEEVAAAEVNQDTEILRLAKNLLDKFNEFESRSDSAIINQNAGDNAIQFGQVSGDVTIKR